MLAHGQFLPRLAIDHRFQIQDLAFHLMVFLHHFVEVELEIKQILIILIRALRLLWFHTCD